MTLTEISIKRPSLIIVIFTILIGGGLICYNKLSYELLPDFSPPVLTVTTVYPGASPSTVENQVSKPLEDALSGLENVTEYALSDLRILKTGEGESKIKMYMFGKSMLTSTWMSYIVRDYETKNRNILSIHNSFDGLRDQGITILDKSCWERMITFFKSMKPAGEIDLMNNERPVKIIARLNVL